MKIYMRKMKIMFQTWWRRTIQCSNSITGPSLTTKTMLSMRRSELKTTAKRWRRLLMTQAHSEKKDWPFSLFSLRKAGHPLPAKICFREQLVWRRCHPNRLTSSWANFTETLSKSSRESSMSRKRPPQSCRGSMSVSSRVSFLTRV